MRGVTNRISERRAKREAHSSPGEKALSHCSQSSSKSPQLHLLLLWPSASYTEESEDLGLLSGLVLCQQHIKTMHAVGGINTRCIGELIPGVHRLIPSSVMFLMVEHQWMCCLQVMSCSQYSRAIIAKQPSSK